MGKKYGQDAVLTQTKKTATVSPTRKGGLGKDENSYKKRKNVKRIKAGSFKPGQTSPAGDTQIKKKTFAYK